MKHWFSSHRVKASRECAFGLQSSLSDAEDSEGLCVRSLGTLSWDLWVRRVGDSAEGEGGLFQGVVFGGGVGSLFSFLACIPQWPPKVSTPNSCASTRLRHCVFQGCVQSYRRFPEALANTVARETVRNGGCGVSGGWSERLCVRDCPTCTHVAPQAGCGLRPLLVRE